LETEGEVVSRDDTIDMFTEYLEDLDFVDLLTVQFK